MRAFAEWEEQEALLVSLPHASTDWAPYLGEIRAAYRDFIAAAARFEPVVAIAPSREDFEQICGGLANVSFAQIDTDVDPRLRRDRRRGGRQNHGAKFSFQRLGRQICKRQGRRVKFQALRRERPPATRRGSDLRRRQRRF